MEPVFSTREDRSDGLDLRTLRFGAEEVSSRIYFALRDEHWRTVDLRILTRNLEFTSTGFRIEIEAESTWHSHPFELTIRYLADGPELIAEFDGRAGADFDYNRVGFNVLHPTSYFAGVPAVSRHDGRLTEFEFPREIVTLNQRDEATVRFRTPFDGFGATLPSGTRLDFAFAGDAFEIEDQRNWTDASFKTYSTPMAELWPHHASPGQRFSHRVRLAIAAAGSAVGRGAAGPAPSEDAGPGVVEVGNAIGTVPDIRRYRGRVSTASYRPHDLFTGLNQTRPVRELVVGGHDSIELGVNGSVHAADDDSVLEATVTHGDIVRQVRAQYPGPPVRLAPLAFSDIAGDWLDSDGEYVPAPPSPSRDPRRTTEFAATWVLASAASAAAAGVSGLRYFDSELPDEAPAAREIERLGALSGSELLDAKAPGAVAVLAVRVEYGIEIALANPGPDPVRLRLPDRSELRLDGFASVWRHIGRESALSRAASASAAEQPADRR